MTRYEREVTRVGKLRRELEQSLALLLLAARFGADEALLHRRQSKVDADALRLIEAVAEVSESLHAQRRKALRPRGPARRSA